MTRGQVRRRRWVAVAIAAMAGFLIGAAPPASNTLVVTANNVGAINFTLSRASYDFGTVNANGGPNAGGTQALTGTVSANGASFPAPAAATWHAASSPAATIYIYNASTSSVLAWGVPDRLQMQIPITGLPAGSVSCAFKNFSTIGDGGAAGCGSGNLVRNVLVKNGANAVNGNLDLQLFVDNTDATGVNVWVVVITEVGL